MKSLEICKSNLYKTKGLNNILLLDSPLGLGYHSRFRSDEQK